jgi:TonB-linked outer membrane protein, SusC/RagA family
MKKLIILCLAVFIANIATAQVRVTGTVTYADDGTPVAYATVTVKGVSGVGVYTDGDGKYSLDNVASNATLIFSFLGYTTQEVPVSGRSVINVSLVTDASSFDEVMVVAYGTVKKGTFTGAASVVKQDAIKDVPTTSFQNALTGRVSGMNVSTRSGQAGTTPSIRIRGTGSINASNEPLYVIDGVPVSSGSAGLLSGELAADFNNVMNTLNPADIESITVLKDAAASSLYGSRAANGIVVITTKRGKTGAPKIDFRATTGFTPTFATDNWEVASTQQNIEMYYEMFWNAEMYEGSGDKADASKAALEQLNRRFGGIRPPSGATPVNHGYIFSAPDNTVNSLTISGVRAGTEFDWEKALMRTASYQSYDVAVSGATETTNYYTSLSYTKEQGRNVMNTFDRVSARVNLNQKIGKFLEFSSNINLARSNNKGINDSRNTGANPFMQLRNLLWGMYWPTHPEDGRAWTDRYGSYAYNQVYYNNEWDNNSKTLRISAVESLTAHILPSLDIKTILSYDNINTLEFLYYSRNHYNGANDKGSATNFSTNSDKIVSSTTANFNKDFNGHTVSLMAGWEAEKNETEYMRSRGINLPTSTLHTVTPAGKMDASAHSWGHNLISFLSRAEYSFNNKYYISGSFRSDGSSKLGFNTRWGNFWSVGGSWRANNESFMSGIDWLSNLRLRSSYGVNGTLPPDNYGHLSLTSYTSKYADKPGGALSSIPNPDLSWETNYAFNVALEFGLLNNRITGTVEYFNRDTKNLLLGVPISMITGLDRTLSNVGEMNNKGLEIELNGDIMRKKDFVWNMGITASTIKSRVTELYGGADIIDYELIDNRFKYIYREGEYPMAFYGYEWAGVDRDTGKNIWFLNNDTPSTLTKDGRPITFEYQDASEVIIGTPEPKLFGGITSDFSWKGLSLNLAFIYKLGGYTYDSVARDVTDDGYYWERVRSLDQYKNRWTPENKDAIYPMMSAIDMEDVNQRSSRHLHPGTFLRLKNLTLSYNLPKNIISKINMSNARIYFSGSNLLTFAKYKVYDPEVGMDGSKGWEMPLGKTYTFGLEFSF